MINNNTVLPLISNLVGQQGVAQTKRNSSERFSSDFKDMLSSNVDRTYTKQNSKRDYAVANRAKSTDKKEPQSKVKSFNEAVSDSQSHLSKNKAVGKEKNDIGVDNKNIEGHSEDDKLEEKVLKESLAKILGITESELGSLMAALNINPRELTDSANIEAIAQKVSDYIGLSSDQQKTLSKILSLMQKEVEHSISDLQFFSNAIQSTEEITAKEGWIELEGTDVEVVEETGEIGDKIGLALNRLKGMLYQQPDKLISQISDKVQDALKNSIEPIDVLSSQIDEKEENSLVGDESRDSSDELEDSDMKSGKESIEGMSSRDNQGFISKAEDNSIGVENISFDVNRKTVQEAELSQTVQSKTPVTRKEIFTQVIEKAKVLLSDEKSEMVIDLKPDHLGKLALKIVTERGFVIAKFIAENEQVKAALESNMNMLKESLENQGFSVQEFSVSVGDNRDRGGYDGNMRRGSDAKNGLKDELPALGMLDVESLELLHSGINPYIDGTSSINLTA